jgi:hypothetical protein
MATDILWSINATDCAMSQLMKVTDSGQWISQLSHLSATVARIAKGNPLPFVAYSDATGQIVEPDPYSLGNGADHNTAFARCFDGLSANGASDGTLRNYLGTLTNGNKTYGTASELLTYLWLLDHRAKFEIQIPLTGADILNPKGSDLDGKLTFSSDVFYDIKGFGFQENMIARLVQRLEADIPGKWIAAQGSWDVSAEALEDLLAKGYQTLRDELRQSLTAKRDVLEFVKRDKRPVQVSHRTVDPYQFAAENSSYLFRFAKQFCRSHPFFLIVAYHPWFGGQALNTNFADFTPTATRSLARRTFHQFLRDTSPVFDITKAEASKLLSGIAFLNVSQVPGTTKKDHVLRLYLNPNAAHPIDGLTTDSLGLHDPHSVAVDDFRFDSY